MEELLTVKDIMRILQVTEQTVQRYVLRKKIPYLKINRMLRFRPSEIDQWIASERNRKAAKGKAKPERELLAETEAAEAKENGAGND
jgi:excisionase family DNA binding protein